MTAFYQLRNVSLVILKVTHKGVIIFFFFFMFKNFFLKFVFQFKFIMINKYKLGLSTSNFTTKLDNFQYFYLNQTAGSLGRREGGGGANSKVRISFTK